MSTFYVTTPIYYVNDVPHIGHGYTTVMADIIARWHRQRGESVWFLTGTDEHGLKVLHKAIANGVEPQEWADTLVAQAWQPLLDLIDASNDDFIRTTQDRHVQGSRLFWRTLYDRGAVYKGTFEGYYSVASEEFVNAADVEPGTGPDAGFTVSKLDGSRVEMVSEENYFFRLSQYESQLLAFYDANPDFIQPESARNEVVSFVKRGLHDLSISRSTFDWGITVPWDSSHVFYVWIEALLNYITAAGYGSDDGRFRELWPASLHLVGKDIIRFHAVIWPAMLLAAGEPVPHRVFAHGWLLVGGQKMSKSKANGIHPSTIIDTFGSDAFRYYLARAIAFGNDGSISWEDIHARYNAELANGLGNLAARTTAMISTYFHGELPSTGPLTSGDRGLIDMVAAAADQADAAIDELAPHRCIRAVWQIVDELNGYITAEKPWQLAGDPGQRARLATVLVIAVEGIRALAVLLHPVLPKATAALWHSLGAEPALGPLADQRIVNVRHWPQLPVGTRVTKGPALFPRVDA